MTPRSVCSSRLAMTALLALSGLVCPTLGQGDVLDRGLPQDNSYRLAGAEVAWRIYIPQRSIDVIRAFHLVDEYVYGVGSNGWVWAIDARTGERQWSRAVVDEGYALWPPVSGRRYQADTVAFTRLTNFSLLRLEDGMETLTYRLTKPSSGPVGLTGNLAISNEVDRRIRAYDLNRRYAEWMVDTRGALQLSPLIVSAMREPAQEGESGLAEIFEPDVPLTAPPVTNDAGQAPVQLEFAEIFYIADTLGEVGAGYASDKLKLFRRRVEGRPEGGLAADDQHLYVATSEQWIYALDRKEGTTAWRRRLAREPVGRPIVAGPALYIALRGDGVERFDLSGDRSEGVILEGCRQFLAEWPTRVALLGTDGHVTLFEKGTWTRSATLGPETFDLAISNAINDAVIVGTKRGDLRCIRPVNSPPLTMDDFLLEDLKKAIVHREKVEQAEKERATAAAENGGQEAPQAPPEEAAVPERIEDRILADPLRSRRP